MSDRLDSLAHGENFVFKKAARIAPAQLLLLLEKRIEKKESSHSISKESLHAPTHHLYFPQEKNEMQLPQTKMSYFFLPLFFCLCLPPVFALLRR